MPDAARLMAAIGMAVLAFIVSFMVMGLPLFEEDTNFGWFVHVNVVVGLIVGWTVIGSRAGRSIVSAINVGLTAPVVLVIWCLFIQSCNEMVRIAMKNRYDNAFDAIAAIFQIMAEWGLLLLTVPILGTGAVAAFVAGVLTEYAWRTWR